MTKTVKIVLGSAVGVILLIVFLMNINTDNTEIDVRERYGAQKEVCAANFDKMWKIIKSVAQVSEQYKETFLTAYKPMMEGRYDQATMMKWVQEDNPDFDVSLYADLNIAIEANRNAFFREQQKLIDINRVHKNLLQKFPSSIFIDGGIEFLDHKIITSTKTEKVFATGKEDDIDLF